MLPWFSLLLTVIVSAALVVNGLGSTFGGAEGAILLAFACGSTLWLFLDDVLGVHHESRGRTLS